MGRVKIWSALVLLLALIGCSKPAPAQPARETKAQSTVTPPKIRSYPRIDACSLITKEEVGTIQVATILEAKSSETSDGTYLISQCYYASRQPNMSVSFTLTEPDPSNPAGLHPREYWERIFSRLGKQGEAEEEKKEEKRGEEEEKKVPPKRVDGVGEEAFWTGNRFGGALYVLKNDFILRISVGGPGEEEVKIDKSKALAAKAMSRL